MCATPRNKKLLPMSAMALTIEAPMAGLCACCNAPIDAFGIIMAVPKKIINAGANSVYRLIKCATKAMSISNDPVNIQAKAYVRLVATVFEVANRELTKAPKNNPALDISVSSP